MGKPQSAAANESAAGQADASHVESPRQRPGAVAGGQGSTKSCSQSGYSLGNSRRIRMRRNWLVDDGWLLPAWLCSVAADDGGDDDGDGGGSRGDDGGSRSDDGGPG